MRNHGRKGKSGNGEEINNKKKELDRMDTQGNVVKTGPDRSILPIQQQTGLQFSLFYISTGLIYIDSVRTDQTR